jgi:endonuclease/exonuclease/phosphatase family metal-dependent hydrolase
MAISLRKISKSFFVIGTAIFILMLLLGGIIPYTQYASWPGFGFIALAYPYLIILVVIATVFWLVAKPRYALFCGLALLLCYKQIGAVFNFSSSSFTNAKPTQALRVLSWNVKIFEGIEKRTATPSSVAPEILFYIKETNADVVCLQEFSQYNKESSDDNHIKGMRNVGYPYYYFSGDYQKASVDYESGVIIFSKLPLLSPQRVAFTNNKESVAYADVVHENDTFRIFTTHLQSFKFNKNDYKSIADIKARKDGATEASKNLISKMSKAFEQRASQVAQLKTLLNNSPYPEIMCADMNDVPNSNAYWQLLGNRKDAFTQKGKGLGVSFRAIAPTLRIDYIMCNKNIEVQQFTTVHKKLSDHYPLIADLHLIKKP